MRTVFWLLLTLSGVGAAEAQLPPATAPPSASSPSAAALSVTEGERRYFELGNALAAVAFAYAPLAQQATPDPHTRSTDVSLTQIDLLAPQALTARADARDKATRAVLLMHLLGAPAKALAPVARLAARLNKPLVLTGTARQIAAADSDAATVLATLGESTTFSRLLNDTDLRGWLKHGLSGTGRVWYAEGQLAVVAQVAAALNQPDLLPPTADLTTDLRGLRDWLAGRLPETPTPEQTALQTALDQFLQQNAMAARKPKPLTTAQLSDLGDISRMLQAEILPDASLDGTSPSTLPTPPHLN